MNDAPAAIYRVIFRHSDFLRLPAEDQLFCVRLAHVMDDLRHVFYLCVAAERGTHSASADERKLGLHQLLFGVRLVYSILHEGWNVINDTWSGERLGKTWDPRLSDEGRDALTSLRKYFGSENLSRTIRHSFGFHYNADVLREPLAYLPHSNDEIITGGKNRGQSFFLAFVWEERIGVSPFFLHLSAFLGERANPGAWPSLGRCC